MLVSVLLQVFVLSTSVCLNSSNYLWFPSAPPLPTTPALPLMLLCCLSRLEPEILLRAKQDFMKIDSAADLEWVSFTAVQHVQDDRFLLFLLICSLQLTWPTWWVVVKRSVHFCLDCSIQEIFAPVLSFSSEVLTEMIRAPSTGDVVNVHRCLVLAYCKCSERAWSFAPFGYLTNLNDYWHFNSLMK